MQNELEQIVQLRNVGMKKEFNEVIPKLVKEFLRRI